MITGAHAIIYSKDADKDRAFLKDVLKLKGIDSGGGWLIFALPPSEIAVHPIEGKEMHEIFFLTDDVKKTIKALTAQRIKCSAVREERWGSITQVSLPGGGQIGLYQPKHPRP